VPETRIYAATNGSCLVGDCTGRPWDEEQRIATDFRNRTRFVVDRRHAEIRCFIPAKRQSAEAFYAVHSVPSVKPMDIGACIEIIMRIFEARDGWSIRTDTVEGRFLKTLDTLWNSQTAETDTDAFPRLSSKGVIGVPDGKSAATHVFQTFGQTDSEALQLYIVSLSKSIPDVDPDILVHISDSYGDVTIHPE